MGFGEKWIIWIRFCITTVKYSMIVNGRHGILLTKKGHKAGSQHFFSFWLRRGSTYFMVELWRWHTYFMLMILSSFGLLRDHIFYISTLPCPYFEELKLSLDYRLICSKAHYATPMMFENWWNRQDFSVATLIMYQQLTWGCD